MQRIQDERVKQAAIAAGIFAVLTVVVGGLLISWRFLPGILGEWVGTMVGIVTTPFFMEASFATLGLLIVISLNIWRRHKDGDDFVYLDQLEGPDVPGDLPENAKWALYREKPLEGEEPGALAQAEGAFEIGDLETAMEWIGEMSREELKQPETLKFRLQLARATGRMDLARALEAEIGANPS